MNPTSFDEFTKALATAVSRRQSLKILVATAAGGLLWLNPLGPAFAHDDDVCGGGNCPPESPVCCPGGGTCCPSNYPVCCGSGCCPSDYPVCGDNGMCLRNVENPVPPVVHHHTTHHRRRRVPQK